MTVSNANDAAVTVTVDTDGQVEFDFDFLVYAGDQIFVVYLPGTDDEQLLALGADFTLDGVGNQNGGSIDITPSGIVTSEDEQLLIYRAVPIKRASDYAIELRAAALNRELDQMIMMIQELRRDADRSLKSGMGTDPGPLPAWEAGKLLGWNAIDAVLENKALADTGGEALPVGALTFLQRNALDTAFQALTPEQVIAALNAKELNADGAWTFATTAEPSQPFSVTPFAGASAFFRANQVFKHDFDDRPTTHPRTGVAFNRIAFGGGMVLTNPFSTTNGSAVVTVDIGEDHNLSAGQGVEFSNATAVGGITIDGDYDVLASTGDHTFTITHSIAATATAQGGGTVYYSDEGDKGTNKANSAMVVFAEKFDWRYSPNYGELDAIGYVITAQGKRGDTACINLQPYKIDGRFTDGLGSVMSVEFHAAWVDPDFALPPDFANLTPNWEWVFAPAYGESPGPAASSVGQGLGMGALIEGRHGQAYALLAGVEAITSLQSSALWFEIWQKTRNQNTAKYGLDTEGRSFWFRLLNSATDYEAGVVRWNGAAFQIGTSSIGAGSGVREFELIRDDVVHLRSTGSGPDIPNNVSFLHNGTAVLGPEGYLRLKSGVTEADLGNAAHPINTTNKALYKTVVASDTVKVYLAGGTTPTSAWVCFDAATANIVPA